MKKTLSRLFVLSIEISLVVASALFLLLVARKPGGLANASAAGSGGSVPVIVELFTSEGCSSCPPADSLLARYEKQQPVVNAQIIALEEHVDYWNELGWVDPFSAKEYTERQAQYAMVLKNGNPYTPQIVVDGYAELVGSREGEAQQQIVRAAATSKSRVSLNAGIDGNGRELRLDVKVDKLPEGSTGDVPEVWLAITESGLHSGVTRGENAGRELYHASIVRELRKIGTADRSNDVPFSRSVSVALSPQWKRPNLHAVVFVQERSRRRILAAGVTSVSN
jgi:hypothetical protein